MPTATEPMKDGAYIYTTDRNVPGTPHVQLEFTLQYKDKQYLATVVAVCDGVSLPRPRFFPHPFPEPIHAWAATLVEAINRKFKTNFGGVLENELKHLMDTPTPETLKVAPAAQKIESVLAPRDLFMRKDTWQTAPEAEITQPEIITILTLRPANTWISCLLHVEYESKSCDLPTAVRSVEQVYAWLGEYDTAKYVVEKLGLQDSYALALCKRWMERFNQPLQEWHQQVPPPAMAKA